MKQSRERDSRVRALLAGLVHALLMYLAFAPMGLWGCALLAPFPIIMAMQLRTKKPCLLGLVVVIGTLPFWLYEQFWITRVSALGYVPLAVFCALWTWPLVWFGNAMGAKSRGLRRLLLIVMLWTGIDFVRGAIFGGGYPWYFVSQPLIDAPGVPEVASIVGQYGVTAVLVLAVTAALVLVDERQRKVAVRVLVGVFLAFGAMIWGGVLLRPAASGWPIRVAIVQTSIESDNKVNWTIPDQLEDFGRFAELTRQAAAGEPDLIVWPETMLPGGPADPASVFAAKQRGIYIPYKDAQGQDQTLMEGSFADAVEALQADVGVTMLIGGKAADGLAYVSTEQGLSVEHQGTYNSALVVSDGRIQDQRYDKVHLTPFGEKMPFISLWPWLESKLLALGANGMRFDLASGKRSGVLELNLGEDKLIRAGTPICFESTVSGISRSMANGRDGVGAEILFNLTNDGWFGNSDVTRAQHLLLARWRSAELARPMVRAANTGVSAFIDTRGMILGRGVEGDAAGNRVEGVLHGEIAPVRGQTIYARIGDVVGVASLLGMVLMCAGSVIRKKKRGAPPSRT